MELSHHRGERVLRYPRPRGLGCRHVRYVYVCSVYRCVACIYVWCTRAWCVHVGCAHTNIVVCACDVCPQNDLHTLTVQPAVCRPVYAHVHTSVNTSDVFAQVFCTRQIYICDVQACVRMVCSTVSVVLQAQTSVHVSSCAPLGKTALQRSPLLLGLCLGKSPECGWGDASPLPTLCSRPLHSWLNLIPAGVRNSPSARCFPGLTVDLVYQLFKRRHPFFLKKKKKSGRAGG